MQDGRDEIQCPKRLIILSQEPIVGWAATAGRFGTEQHALSRKGEGIGWTTYSQIRAVTYPVGLRMDCTNMMPLWSAMRL